MLKAQYKVYVNVRGHECSIVQCFIVQEKCFRQRVKKKKKEVCQSEKRAGRRVTRPLQVVVGATDTYGAGCWVWEGGWESLEDGVAFGVYGSEAVGIMDSRLVGDKYSTRLCCFGCNVHKWWSRSFITCVFLL